MFLRWKTKAVSANFIHIFLTYMKFPLLILSEFHIIYCPQLKQRCLVSLKKWPTSKKEPPSETKKTNTHCYPHKKKWGICYLLHLNFLCIILFLKITQTYCTAYLQKFFIKYCEEYLWFVHHYLHSLSQQL